MKPQDLEPIENLFEQHGKDSELACADRGVPFSLIGPWGQFWGIVLTSKLGGDF